MSRAYHLSWNHQRENQTRKTTGNPPTLLLFLKFRYILSLFEWSRFSLIATLFDCLPQMFCFTHSVSPEFGLHVYHKMWQDLRLKLEDARETVEMLREQLRRERERHAQAQAQHQLSAHSQSSDASAAAPPNSGLSALQHSGSGSDTESRVGAAGSNGLPSRGSAECSKCPNRSDHCIYKKERDSLVVELEAARSQVLCHSHYRFSHCASFICLIFRCECCFELARRLSFSYTR